MKYEMTENTKIVYGKTLTQIRYKQGVLGGWISDPSVLPQDSNAVVYSDAMIFGGEIRGGKICGGKIFGGKIFGGKIFGGKICGGEIFGGKICGGEIFGGEIFGGKIHGGKICGGKIYGGVIRGGEINIGMIVTRDPIHLILPNHHVTISDNMVAVGCQIHPFVFWKDKEKVQELGDDNDYTQQEIDMYFDVINALIRPRP